MVQSDGSIIVAGSMNGHFALLRYDSYGTRDTDFGEDDGAINGIVIANFGGTDEMAAAMALDGNGNVLVAGTSNQTATGKDFALARFSTSGVFDSAFGLVTMDFVGGDDEASSIAIQPSDGKIVVAGSSDDGTGYVTFALARFDTEGNPDGDFGPGGSLPTGTATTDFGDGNDRISGLQVQYDGRIIVSGTTLLDGSGTPGSVPHFAVARYNPDGTPDESFGPGGTLPAGTVTTDFVALGITLEIDYITESSCGIILDTTGRLVVAGTATADDFSSFAVACYDPGELTLDVQAANVPPVLRVLGDQQAAVGQTLELSELGVFIHAPVENAFTYEIDWGDGSEPDSGTANTALQGAVLVGTLGGQHTYTASGTYHVAATVTDPDGGSDTQTLSITVEANARPLPSLVVPGGLTAADISAGGVRFAGGEVVLAADDLGLGTARSYTNQWQSQGADDLDVGLGWQLDESPYVVRTADGAAVVFGAQRSLWFTESGSNYSAKFGAKELLTHDAENHLFTLVGTDGTIWQFDDFSFFGSRMGQFRGMVTPGGQATEVTGWAFDGRIAEMQWRASAAAVPYEMRLYLYLREGANAGRLESVEVWRNEANDAPVWQRVRKVTYDYYETGEFEYNGVTGDLKTATLQFFGLDGSGYDWLGDQTTYYRYYTSGAEAGLLKMVVSAEGAFQAESHSVELATALDSSLLPYSSRYYEYDSSRRVSEATIGGIYTYTYQYADSTASDGYNAWKHKTTEDRPDGSSYTVYTNFLGQVLLTDLEDQSENHWYTFREYGTAAGDKGLLHRQAMPSAITTAAEGTAAGSFDIDFAGASDDAGLVYHYTHYATGAAGYLESAQVQEGWSGPASTLTSYEYVSRSGGGATVYFVSSVSIYPDGSTPVETVYDYAWYDDSVQIKERKTTLPPVAVDQNGSGESAVRFERFTAAGNLEWAADERERFTHYEYDDVTGLLAQVVEDVDAGSSHTPPTFAMLDWPSLPADGDGLNLETDYQYDALGRVTQVLGPAHTSLLSADDEEATEVRTAVWYAYIDTAAWFAALGIAAEIRSASGYEAFDPVTHESIGFTLANPVSIIQFDRDGRATAAIQAVSGSGTYIDDTRLEYLSRTEFPTSSYTQHATHQYNAAGQLTADGIFTNLTLGQQVYSQSDYGYDSMGRLCRVKTPGEVITESFFDARGLTTIVWVGSNDQMTTDYNSDGAMDFRDFRQWIADHPTATEGPVGTNLVPVTSYVYDSGNAGGDGHLTGLVQHVDATTDRTTEYGHDWRGRTLWMLVNDGTYQTYTFNSFDNLGRVTEVGRYEDRDADGVFIDGHDGDETNDDVLIGRSTAAYDARGQVYQTAVYGVNPANGQETGSLTANFWHDAAGNLVKSQAGGTQQFTKTKGSIPVL